MSETNGKLQSPRQMKRHGVWSSAGSPWWMKLLGVALPVRVGFLLLLLAGAMSLTACATTSAPPESGPRNPEPPPTRLSESPPDYLSNAQRSISQWRKTLQELIQKPAN